MSLHDTLLSADRSALFVVDPQERLMAAIYEADRVVRNTSLLVHCAKALGMPVMASTQYKKGLGPLVPELAGLLADDPSIDKVEFNAFACSGTARILERFPSRVDTLILAGAEAHIVYTRPLSGLLRPGTGSGWLLTRFPPGKKRMPSWRLPGCRPSALMSVPPRWLSMNSCKGQEPGPSRPCFLILNKKRKVVE